MDKFLYGFYVFKSSFRRWTWVINADIKSWEFHWDVLFFYSSMNSKMNGTDNKIWNGWLSFYDAFTIWRVFLFDKKQNQVMKPLTSIKVYRRWLYDNLNGINYR